MSAFFKIYMFFSELFFSFLFLCCCSCCFLCVVFFSIFEKRGNWHPVP